jgi:hypothetical protein
VNIWAHFLLRKKPGFPGVPPLARPLRAPPIPCAVVVAAVGGHGGSQARSFAAIAPDRHVSRRCGKESEMAMRWRGGGCPRCRCLVRGQPPHGNWGSIRVYRRKFCLTNRQYRPSLHKFSGIAARFNRLFRGLPLKTAGCMATAQSSGRTSPAASFG